MKISAIFAMLMGAAGIAVAISGCAASGPAPQALSQPPLPTATPAARWLYVDHNGTLYEYLLPLTSSSQPVRTLTEWPKLPVPPQIAVDQYGNVALASTEEIRLFRPPILSFAASRASVKIPLTPAITQIGISGGADLVDIEFDPNENLWLLNNLGAGISMLRPPLSKNSVAALSLGFGAPGSKTAGFTQLIQARFDVNAALYVFAASTNRSRLFKISFPYARPPGNMGISLGTANFVDPSQWPPTARSAPALLLGQYTGPLRSPHPGQPPSPPVDVTSQFNQPFNPQVGLFPNAHMNTIMSALIADTYRYSFYALEYGNGQLDAYDLPMTNNATAKVTLKCLAGLDNCGAKPEHLFLAP